MQRGRCANGLFGLFECQISARFCSFVSCSFVFDLFVCFSCAVGFLSFRVTLPRHFDVSLHSLLPVTEFYQNNNMDDHFFVVGVFGDGGVGRKTTVKHYQNYQFGDKSSTALAHPHTPTHTH